MAGGEPLGLLVVDHELRHVPERSRPGAAAPVDDISVLSALASVGAAAFVPIVLAASPALLGVDQFEDLALSSDVAAAFRDDDHLRWRQLATREDTRFVCVLYPACWRGRAGGRSRRTRTGSAMRNTLPKAAIAPGRSPAMPLPRRSVARNHCITGQPISAVSAPTASAAGSCWTYPPNPFLLGPGTVWNRPSLDLARPTGRNRT